MIGYIYLTINDINPICYIGKRQKPKFDKAYKGSGTHLKLALEKYGRNKFHTFILQRCETVKELCEAEKKWIALFKGYGVELYNIGAGGDGGNMIDWASMPVEKRIEINKKNSDSHMGCKNPFYGKHHSEKTKAVIAEKNKGRAIPAALVEYKARQRNGLPAVAQIDKKTGKLIKVWENWCEASKAVSPKNRCGYSHIGECCRHERKTAYGYRWEFAEAGWIV